MERQVYLWYVPQDAVGHAARLREIGCRHVRVKAGGDDGRLWRQWSNPALTDPYRAEGLRVTPWFYTWPTAADREVVVRAHEAQPFDEYALNPETEWRWRNSNENPWRSLAEANEGAAAWLATLDALLPGVRRAFSGVPTWTDFPYEAWAAGCAQAEPQHYWPDNLLADDGESGSEAGEDQVEAHLRRAGRGTPCVPILTASREYDDTGVVALARNALADYPTLLGFSAWEAGNAAFQWMAVKRAYGLLSDEIGEQRRHLPPNAARFGPFGKFIGGGFRRLYESTPDAVTLFGHPVTDELREGGLTVQYFERARFEFDEQTGTIGLGRVGVELARSRGLTSVF